MIAGLQKNSLIDFPDKVACVVFLNGCNFACPYCHNPDLARGQSPQILTAEQLMEFLRPRRVLLDGVVLSGGEPTLAPGLSDLCCAIRELGLAVKLDTNGSRPDILTHLFSRGVLDYVAMDIKTDPAAYAPPLAPVAVRPLIARSIRLIIESGLDYEFRTTCVRPFVDETSISAMARAIQGARRYMLQPLRQTHLLNPDFFKSNHPAFSPEEMIALQQSAVPWVRQCLIRA